MAETIRDLREQAGLSTTEVARRLTEAGRPTHQTTMTRLESGNRAITVDDVAALAAVLGVRPAALLPGMPQDPDCACRLNGHSYDSREITGPGPRVCNDCQAIEEN
ncbi:helix-turn-helix transcriptional regulator [Streptomyces sp. NBC_00078]|uniref:helix-turn-helix domain-containing protein n=1 Tax=unclassified Streptomyces TaxID=2593676 RepID=UPI0022518945|nr:helix-turn-helix transcriptional regulator [Streptomyces sp. NBC_00078]MCX5419949.1 helix-turn-helix domain-containing protein [Streptomyces sp. NBC_00078]